MITTLFLCAMALAGDTDTPANAPTEPPSISEVREIEADLDHQLHMVDELIRIVKAAKASKVLERVEVSPPSAAELKAAEEVEGHKAEATATSAEEVDAPTSTTESEATSPSDPGVEDTQTDLDLDEVSNG